MALGYDIEQRVIDLNDTASLVATLYERDTEKPVSADDLVAVSFVIQKPDESQITAPGLVADSGAGLLHFQGTDQLGHYAAVATFTTVEGHRRSVRCDFDVRDPFYELPTASATYVLATQIWARIEDCFDADEAGPWLQDMTLNTFNKNKMESFLDLALFDINNLNPPTTLAVSNFVSIDPNTHDVLGSPDTPLLVQGGFLVCLRHLMTSYVEQPQPSGAQIAWQDRRDYLTRWAALYTIEFQVYDRMAKLYKRRYLGLGQTRSLVATKAGRLIPAPMRTWSVGRGFW